jgi:tRNA (mo5U34)-methyltransferase
MIDYPSLWQCLTDLGLDNWRAHCEPLLQERLSDAGHGDFKRWRRVIENLDTLDEDDSTAIRESLMSLSPWRKGPFKIGNVVIDAEWQSDLKWNRLQDGIAPLDDRNVLDVGCGNGYYALQMWAAGARSVVGIDPTILTVMQFRAISRFSAAKRVFVLPLRLHELPEISDAFDTTFSMGVLYHQRSPIDHLRQLRSTLRPGGQLVLETLFMPGEDSFARTPTDRYARMRNVWLLPSVAELRTWLQRSGFVDVQIIDETITTTNEQRSTEWMTFESLAEALDPTDPSRTVEGWPAPRRVVAIANAP